MTERKPSETRPEPWAWLEGVDANGSPVKIPSLKEALDASGTPEAAVFTLDGAIQIVEMVNKATKDENGRWPWEYLYKLKDE